MPLGERGPGDSSDSRYCGVETDFDDDMPKLLSLHLSQTGFDFVVASLMNPTYRPSLVKGSDLGGSGVLPFAGSDLSPSQWSSHVWGKISSWIDLDSEDETLRMDSETTLKQEIAWASYLSLQVCLLPTPRGNSCANYARCVNQILQGLKDMQLLLRIPLVRAENDSDNKSSPYSGDTWELWNSFRVLCEHHSQLSVALDILTLPSEKSLGRWFGEPLRVSIISTDIFYTNNRGYPRLSRRYQKLFSEFFNHSIQVLISGKQLHKPRNGSKGSSGIENKGEGEPKHPLRPYLDYLSFLYKRMGPLPEQELSELAYRDFLQTPLQTLTDDNLEAQTYETFEKDTIKYTQYRRAIAKALLDRVSDEEAADATTVLMAIGVGVGPLVRASFQAAEETGRTLKVYAVEKNPNAVVTLVNLLKLEGWENFVNIISSSVCHWDSPEMADILVSDLLGSFGDNQLSPECIDKAQRFLKQDGISIPMSYTSFIQPITASKLYNDVRLHKDLDFESAYVVKLHNIAKLAPSQPVFTFTHPNHSSSTKSNKRYTKLQFEIPIDTVSVMVHGFAGYFDSVLYGDIHLGTEPSTSTPNMFSWFPMFFPLRSPVYVQPGSILEVHFWRCVGSTEVNKPSKGNKFWYEWWVSSPCSLPVHNPDGRSYWVRLDFDSS